MKGVLDRQRDESGRGLAGSLQPLAPFADLGHQKMREAPFVNTVKPLFTPFFTGQLMRQQQGVKRFGMRPPEFHFGTWNERRMAFCIKTKNNSAIFLVPASFQMPAQDLGGGENGFAIIFSR